MNRGNYNHIATQLLNRQIACWPLATQNYQALALVETRELIINDHPFTIQFNPARITSSSANIEPQTIQERTCFLCRSHLPPEQEVLPYTAQSGNKYMILCNPFPIFPHHLTIADATHHNQRILGRINDMISLAEQLSDFILLYNGPHSGASAPDHFHFQAGNKGFLPIQNFVERGISIEHYPIPFFLFSSHEPSSVAASFNTCFNTLQDLSPLDPEPKLNLLCWKTANTFYLVLFPRKQHRPAEYFAEGDAHILLSPGVIDLSGVIITPLEKDFRKITTTDVINVFNQICLSWGESLNVNR